MGRAEDQMYNERGVTFVEIMAILVIIGILGLMSIPRIGSSDRSNVYTTARRIAADMRYARILAITKAKDHVLEFAPSGGPYTEYTIMENGIQLGDTRHIPAGITCVGTEEFTFEPLGNALSDGVSNNGMVSLIMGTDRCDVNVIATTGRAYTADM